MIRRTLLKSLFGLLVFPFSKTSHASMRSRLRRQASLLQAQWLADGTLIHGESLWLKIDYSPLPDWIGKNWNVQLGVETRLIKTGRIIASSQQSKPALSDNLQKALQRAIVNSRRYGSVEEMYSKMFGR